MADENIILAVEIDSRNALTQLDLLSQAVEDAKKKQDELNKQFKEGAISRDEYNKATKENTKEIKAAEAATKSLTTAVTVEAGSINALREANKKLTQERNSLGDATGKNAVKISELNEQINKNDKAIKDSSSTLEKNRLNIGNYSSALDGISGSLNRVVPGFSGMKDGLMGITNGAKAFSATPLTGILTIISTVLPLIIDSFKKFAPLMDSIEDTVAAVSNTFKGLFENFDLLIKAIGGSSDDWSNLSKAINDTRAEGQRLLDVQRELDDRYLDYQLRAAKSGPEIKQLLEDAKDRTLTETQRQDKLNEALKKEKDERIELIAIDKLAFENKVDEFVFENKKRIKSTEEEIKAINAKAQESIIVENALQSKRGGISEERRKQIESERDADIARAKAMGGLFNTISKLEDKYEILQELRKSGLFQEKDLQVAADAYTKYRQTIEGGIEIQSKIQRTLDDLDDKRLEKKKKADEDAKKKQEDDKKKAELDAQYTQEAIEARQDAEIQQLSDHLAEIDRITNEATQERLMKQGLEELETDAKIKKELLKQEKEHQDRINEEIEGEKKKWINWENEKLDKLKKAVFQSISLFQQQSSARQQTLNNQLKAEKITQAQYDAQSKAIFERNKKLDIATTTIDTLSSAQKVFRSQVQPGNPLSYVIATALAAQTLAAGYAKVQAIKSTSYDSGGGFSGGTRSGVTATQATTNPINQTYSMTNAFKNMPPVIASWQEATEVRNRVEFKESLTTV